jgi:proteasome lid subunit RPN8/RPN11
LEGVQVDTTELDMVLYREVLEHCVRELPNEACGLIASRDGRAVQVFAMRNADASPVSYQLDPKEQLCVFGKLKREGLDLFGIYHCHTHSDAQPSGTDRQLAFDPNSRFQRRHGVPLHVEPAAVQAAGPRSWLDSSSRFP